MAAPIITANKTARTQTHRFTPPISARVTSGQDPIQSASVIPNFSFGLTIIQVIGYRPPNEPGRQGQVGNQPQTQGHQGPNIELSVKQPPEAEKKGRPMPGQGETFLLLRGKFFKFQQIFIRPRAKVGPIILLRSNRQAPLGLPDPPFVHSASNRHYPPGSLFHSDRKSFWKIPLFQASFF